MSKIDISGLPEKTQRAIEQILHPRVLDTSGLPIDVAHQIEKILETEMKMPPDEAVRVVRSYLNEHKHRN